MRFSHIKPVLDNVLYKNENDFIKIDSGIVVPAESEDIDFSNIIRLNKGNKGLLAQTGSPYYSDVSTLSKILGNILGLVVVHTLDGEEVPAIMIMDVNKCNIAKLPICNLFVGFKDVLDRLNKVQLNSISQLVSNYQVGTKMDLLKLPPNIDISVAKKYSEAPPTVLWFKKLINMDLEFEDSPLVIAFTDIAAGLENGKYIECCGLKTTVANGKLLPAAKYEIKWRPERSRIDINAVIIGFLRITGVYDLDDELQYTFKEGYEVGWGPIAFKINVNAYVRPDGSVSAGYGISTGIPCGNIQPGLYIFRRRSNNDYELYDHSVVRHNNISIAIDSGYECNYTKAPCMGQYSLSSDRETLSNLKDLIMMAKVNGNEFDVNKILLVSNKVIANIVSTLSVPTTHQYHSGIVQYILNERPEIIGKKISMGYY